MIEFGLTCIDCVFLPTSNSGEMRGHQTWQWDLVTSGSMRISTASEALEIGSGESVLTPPWLAHGFHWHEPSRSSSIHFHWPESPQLDSGKLVFLDAKALSSSLMKRFFHYIRFTDTDSRRNAGYCLHLLLGEFFGKAEADRHLRRTLAQAVQTELEGNNYHALPVEELAEACHMSVNNFIRAFREETGDTPARFVLRLRIERAQELMRHTRMNLTGVALSLGFPDLYTFSKAFKRVTGASPKSWCA
jgi:AraC-like DNA-binding protein